MANKNSPPVTVSLVVLTYKRQNDLLETLHTVQRQRYPQLETIVVNNYQDDTVNLVFRHFPETKIISLDENIGCAARNVGVERGAGEIVITIDNDVHLKGDDFIDKVVDFFEQHADAACVTFRVLRPCGELSNRDWCHPRDASKWANETFLTDHISEGACAFRRDQFLEVGGYSQEIFIGHEGPELNLRLLKHGYQTWYCPQLEVYHYASKAARPDWRAHYYNTRNDLFIAYRHFPAGLLTKHIGLYGGMTFYYALKERHLGTFCKGVLDAVRMSWADTRQPLNREQCTKLRQLRKEKPTIWARIRKHFAIREDYR